MLKTIRPKNLKAGGQEFAIVASQYNARYVDSMVAAARAELKAAGVARPTVARVPGAYEIPIVANHLARTRHSLGAIICLGVILRGQTVHAAHIGDAVNRALMRIQMKYEVPVIHEVLLLENEEQARARCLDAKRNRGREAAQTALAMARVMASLRAERESQNQDIPF